MNRRKFLKTAAAAAAGLTQLGRLSAMEPVAGSRVLGGYYPTWSGATLPPEKISYSLYTHIFHAFLLTDAAGTPKLRRGSMPDTSLTSRSRAAGVKTLLSLGGGAYHHFPTITADAARMGRYVERVVRLVDTAGYDGLDLDWEHPNSPATRDGWSRLVRTLRTRLDALAATRRRPMLLTAAVSHSSHFGQWIDAATVRAAVDFLNVMTYDAVGTWGGRAGNHAPLRSDPSDPDRKSMATAMAWWTLVHKIPRDRLVFGLPFYTKVFRGYRLNEKVSPGPGKGITPVGYAEVMSLAARGRWRRRFDSATPVVWYTSPDNTIFAAVDDPTIVAAKTRWARRQAYRGVFNWCMLHDVMPDGTVPLQQAMHAAWRA